MVATSSNSFNHCSVQVYLSFVALVGIAMLEFRQALTGIDLTRETQVHVRSEVTTVCASLWERNNHLNTCSMITRSVHTNTPRTLHPKETKKKKGLIWKTKVRALFIWEGNSKDDMSWLFVVLSLTKLSLFCPR